MNSVDVLRMMAADYGFRCVVAAIAREEPGTWSSASAVIRSESGGGDGAGDGDKR